MTEDGFFITRNEEIDGVGPWLWIKSDSGAWTGPRDDWRDLKSKILKYCDKFDTVVCAGGNQGMYPRLYSNFFDLVYTFEPDGYNFHCLVNNCAKDNIIKIQAALGSEHQMIKMNRGNMTNTGCHTVIDHGGIIPMVMLDDFKFDKLSLIQLDIEKYELKALNGSCNTIAKHRPAIIIESANTEISDFLKAFDYKFITRVGHADTLYLPGEHKNADRT